MATNASISSTRRHAAAAGITFAVLSGAAVSLDRGPADTSTARSLLAHFADDSTAIWWSALLFGFAAVALFVFAASAGSMLQGNDWRRGALLIGATGVGLLQIAGEGSWFVLARQAERDLLEGFQEAWLFHDLADSFFVMENFPAILLVGTLSLIAVDLSLPNWQRSLGLLLTGWVVVNAVIQLLDNEGIGEMTGPLTLIVSVVWALQYSLSLWRIRPASPQATSAANR